MKRFASPNHSCPAAACSMVSTATKEHNMSVQLNHTIVWCRDKKTSASFLADILGLPAPSRFGPFLVVELENGVSLDFHDSDDEIASQHYAFLLSEAEFDGVFARIR